MTRQTAADSAALQSTDQRVGLPYQAPQVQLLSMGYTLSKIQSVLEFFTTDGRAAGVTS